MRAHTGEARRDAWSAGRGRTCKAGCAGGARCAQGYQAERANVQTCVGLCGAGCLVRRLRPWVGLLACQLLAQVPFFLGVMGLLWAICIEPVWAHLRGVTQNSVPHSDDVNVILVVIKILITIAL